MNDNPFSVRYNCIETARSIHENDNLPPSQKLDAMFVTAAKLYNFINGDFAQIPELTNKIQIVDKKKSNGSTSIEFTKDGSISVSTPSSISLNTKDLSNITIDNYEVALKELEDSYTQLKLSISEKILKEQKENENELNTLKKMAGIGEQPQARFANLCETSKQASTFANQMMKNKVELNKIETEVEMLKNKIENDGPLDESEISGGVIQTFLRKSDTMFDFIKLYNITNNTQPVMRLSRKDMVEMIGYAMYQVEGLGKNVMFLCDQNDLKNITNQVLKIASNYDIKETSINEANATFTFTDGKKIYITYSIGSKIVADALLTEFDAVIMSRIDCLDPGTGKDYKGKVFILS